MQPEAQDSNLPDIRKMGGCMFAGDLAIRKIKDKAILIVGDTRAGKSTLFNYLIKVPLVGVEVEDGTDTIYEQQFQKGVEIKNTYTSVTLVPNVGEIHINGEDMSLVDLAGFFDQARSYVGIFGVSFMLERILETVKQFKFLLTITHPNFEMDKAQDFIKPIANFIRIFELQILISSSHQSVTQKIINSISIVVSKAREQPRYYLSRINRILGHLEANYQNADNSRKIITMILRSVYDNKRIQIFKRAQHELAPQEPRIIQNLNEPAKKWRFYSFEDNLSKQFLFLLPFQKEHEAMKDTDKNQYKNEGIKQNQQMKQSYELLKKFLNKAKHNWYSVEPIDYHEQFQVLQDMIRGHPYGSFELMMPELKIDFNGSEDHPNIVTRFELLDKFSSIQTTAQAINQANEHSEAHTKIRSMVKPCFEIFDIVRKTVCTTRQEEEKFITFMFINMRYLAESEVKNKVDKNQGAGVPFIVNQVMSTILPKSIQDLTCQFLVDINVRSTQKEKYAQTLKKLIENINSISDSEQAKKLLYANIKTASRAGQQFMKKGNYTAGLESLIKAHKDFQNYITILPEQAADKTKEEKDICAFKETHLYHLIAACLEHLGFHRQAVKIYQHTKSTYFLMECYRKKISKERKKKKRFELMEDYIEILQKYNKIDKLICLYERMIDEYPCFPERREELRKKLAFLQQNRKIVHKAEEEQHTDMNELIEAVEADLAYHVNNNDDDEEDDEDDDFLFEHRNDLIEEHQDIMDEDN